MASKQCMIQSDLDMNNIISLSTVGLRPRHGASVSTLLTDIREGSVVRHRREELSRTTSGETHSVTFTVSVTE